MAEEISLRINAIIENRCLTVDVVDIFGSTPQSITRKRIVGILANAIVSVIRGDKNDGDPPETDLIRFAIDQITEGFVDANASFYTPKS